MSKPQSASSHAKMVPMYHYVTFLLLFAPIVYFVVQTVREFSVTHLMLTCLAVGALIGVLFARIFPLGVQDRVIRGTTVRGKLWDAEGRIVYSDEPRLIGEVYPLEGDKAVSYRPFAEGWLRNEQASGRPVDLLVKDDGSLLVSDDFAGKVYRISYSGGN